MADLHLPGAGHVVKDTFHVRYLCLSDLPIALV